MRLFKVLDNCNKQVWKYLRWDGDGPGGEAKFLPTELFMYYGKLNFPQWFTFRLEAIFNTAPAAPKNHARLKKGEN